MAGEDAGELMASFTTPTTYESSDDILFGRYRVTVGISVLWDGNTFVERPYAWLGEIRPEGGPDLIEGETWFQGGRTYTISTDVAEALVEAGFEVDD